MFCIVKLSHVVVIGLITMGSVSFVLSSFSVKSYYKKICKKNT